MNPVLLFAGILVLAFIALLTFSYYKTKNSSDNTKSENIKVLNAKTFKATTNQGLVLVDFWAPWCAPCKMLLPLLNQVADKNTDKIVVARINVEQFKQVAAKVKIKGLPCLVLYKDGVEEKRIVGFNNKKELMKELKPYLQ